MSSIYGEDGGKRHRHTHAGTCGDSLPWLLSAQMLSWGGAVNQCACVCACRRLTVIWGLFSDDSCWHNAPFSLFIYTVQPISISSLFLTPSLFSLSIPRLQVPLFHPFLDISRLTGFWWDAHLLSACSSNKWMPLAHPGTCGARLLLISFLEQ